MNNHYQMITHIENPENADMKATYNNIPYTFVQNEMNVQYVKEGKIIMLKYELSTSISAMQSG